MTAVYIDDISEYGKYLCSKKPYCDDIQEEILMNAGLKYEILHIEEVTANGIWPRVNIIIIKEL